MNSRSRLSAALIVACVASFAHASPDAGLLLAPKAFRVAAAQVEPCLVTIDTVGGVGFDRTNKKQRQKIGGLARPGEGPTTGVIVREDGLILTSTFNFIRQPRIITVTLADGRQYVAELLGRDDTRKVCVLKIKDETVKGLPTPRVAPVDSLRIGQWAISVGLGYGGDKPTVSAGIVSALGRSNGKAVQTDANLSPANYGGPLLDIDGRVIGICTPLNPRTPGAAGAGSEWYDSGIGFAIPLDGLDPIVERMAKGEKIQRGLVGIQPAPKSPEGGGVTVMRVADDSPASEAGLQKDDVITAIDGEPVKDFAALAKALGRHIAGDEVVVSYKRGDQGVADVKVKLGAGPYKFPPPKAVATEPEEDEAEDGSPDGPEESEEPEDDRAEEG